jgi:hypothetical protein
MARTARNRRARSAPRLGRWSAGRTGVHPPGGRRAPLDAARRTRWIGHRATPGARTSRRTRCPASHAGVAGLVALRSAPSVGQYEHPARETWRSPSTNRTGRRLAWGLAWVSGQPRARAVLRTRPHADGGTPATQPRPRVFLGRTPESTGTNARKPRECTQQGSTSAVRRLGGAAGGIKVRMHPAAVAKRKIRLERGDRLPASVARPQVAQGIQPRRQEPPPRRRPRATRTRTVRRNDAETWSQVLARRAAAYHKLVVTWPQRRTDGDLPVTNRSEPQHFSLTGRIPDM